MSDVPPSLAALYASERAAHGPSDADRERIRGAVLASVGVTVAAAAAGKASAAATTASGGIVSKLVVVCVALGAVGGGAALLSRDTSPAVAQRPIASEPRVSREEPASSDASTQPVIASVATPPTPATPAPPPSERRESRAPSVAPAAAATESDARRLARAVALSERGDVAGALALLDGVGNSSALVEERDALRVMMFSKLGRTEEACAAVTLFVARYPDSIHRASVEEVPCSSGR